MYGDGIHKLALKSTQRGRKLCRNTKSKRLLGFRKETQLRNDRGARPRGRAVPTAPARTRIPRNPTWKFFLTKVGFTSLLLQNGLTTETVQLYEGGGSDTAMPESDNANGRCTQIHTLTHTFSAFFLSDAHARRTPHTSALFTVRGCGWKVIPSSHQTLTCLTLVRRRPVPLTLLQPRNNSRYRLAVRRYTKQTQVMSPTSQSTL